MTKLFIITWIFVLLLLWWLIPSVKAEEVTGYKFAKDWSWTDTAYQTAFIGLSIVDWGQTRYVAKNPDHFEESWNFILPKHPTTGEVDIYMASALTIHTLIALALPPKAEWLSDKVGFTVNPRRIWQCIWIGIEVGAVVNNASIGIGWGF